MPKRPTSDILNSHLMATIERQRRIICDLLIKNEALRARLANTSGNADQPPGRESMRRRFDPGRQTARPGEMRIASSNELHLAATAQ